jgi:PHD/YefM family antitoxin component YafN of YafNO toxin-antitoxin module
MESTQKELTLLQKAQDTLTQLSAEKLQVAVDFLAYLQDKEAQEATDELLSIPNFEDELREAEAEAEAGEVVSFESIRRDV